MDDARTVKRDFILAAMQRAAEANYPIIDPVPEDNARDLGWWIPVFDAKSFLFSENGSASWLFPYYELKATPLRGRVVVSGAGSTIVDSRACFEFHETAHPTQIYIPRSEVDMSLLVESKTQTYCPFKNIARHYSVRGADGETIEDAFWSYEEVYDRLPTTGRADGILQIKDMLSPYRNRLTVEVFRD